MREIQVLTGRTHPGMRMQTGGGFILRCTKLAPGMYAHGSHEPVVEENKQENSDINGVDQKIEPMEPEN